MEKTPKWRNGRRRGLKIPCPQGREGSTPFFGRKKRGNRRILSLLFFAGRNFFLGENPSFRRKKGFPPDPLSEESRLGFCKRFRSFIPLFPAWRNNRPAPPSRPPRPEGSRVSFLKTPSLRRKKGFLPDSLSEESRLGGYKRFRSFIPLFPAWRDNRPAPPSRPPPPEGSSAFSPAAGRPAPRRQQRSSAAAPLQRFCP